MAVCRPGYGETRVVRLAVVSVRPDWSSDSRLFVLPVVQVPLASGGHTVTVRVKACENGAGCPAGSKGKKSLGS